MTDPAILYAATLARLKTLTTVEVYGAGVPDSPPADPQGRVFPYAVLWPGAGASPLEQAVLNTAAGVDWMCQVTVAAGDPSWVLPAVAKVRTVLVGFAPTAGAALSDETPRSLLVTPDPDVKPARWFLPLFFGCLTP